MRYCEYTDSAKPNPFGFIDGFYESKQASLQALLVLRDEVDDGDPDPDIEVESPNTYKRGPIPKEGNIFFGEGYQLEADGTTKATLWIEKVVVRHAVIVPEENDHDPSSAANSESIDEHDDTENASDAGETSEASDASVAGAETKGQSEASES